MIYSAVLYIRAGAAEKFCLYRIIPGGGDIFSHDIVNHQKYGISDDDMQDAAKYGTCVFFLSGYIHISPHIEKNPSASGCGIKKTV
jgi:hypothetical protein